MIVTSSTHKRFLLAAVLFFAVLSLYAQTAPKPGIPLTDLAKELSARVFWDPLSGMAVMEKNGHLVNLRAGDGLVLLDYREAVALDPPVILDGALIVSTAFKDHIENFFSSAPAPVSYRVGAILIDPGHGGKDPGAVGTAKVKGKTVQIREKDVVLTVAKDLHEQLSRKWPDKNIRLTRSDDRYISLEDRVEIANSIKLRDHEAILYVSIHANAAFNKKSAGFEVWYLSPDYRRTVIDKSGGESAEILPILNSMMEEEFTTESILIAKSISDSLEQRIGKQSPNRGLKEEAWFVVRNARMPSVLVELGFVTNPGEAALLSDPEYLKRCAAGIYTGLANFIEHFEQSRGFTATP